MGGIMAILRAYLFGGLVLSWDETPVPLITSTAARSLFAYLLTYRDRPHTRNLLGGTFWPGLPDDVARRASARPCGRSARPSLLIKSCWPKAIPSKSAPTCHCGSTWRSLQGTGPGA
jgi:hypothetical protein